GTLRPPAEVLRRRPPRQTRLSPLFPLPHRRGAVGTPPSLRCRSGSGGGAPAPKRDGLPAARRSRAPAGLVRSGRVSDLTHGAAHRRYSKGVHNTPCAAVSVEGRCSMPTQLNRLDEHEAASLGTTIRFFLSSTFADFQ